MSSAVKAWCVGIVGVNPVGLYWIERLSLEPNIHLVGAFDQNPVRLGLATQLGCPSWNHPDSASTSSECDVVFYADQFSVNQISAALLNGKHVVIDRPWLMPSATLRQLNATAERMQRVAMASHHRRWSPDFIAASNVLKSGRLGTLHSARISTFEKAVSREADWQGALREYGYRCVDQLMLLTDSKPARVFAKQFFDGDSPIDHGFLTAIEFEDGCTAMIELQTKSRLSYRTSWMLEGTKGSFRGNRIYEVTTDGEVIDEPLPQLLVIDNAFVKELVSTWQHGPSNQQTLNDVANVVELIEAIERAASSGEVVRLLLESYH